MNYQNNPYLYNSTEQWQDEDCSSYQEIDGHEQFRQSPVNFPGPPGFPFMPPTQSPGQFPNYPPNHQPGRPPNVPPRPPYSGGGHHGGPYSPSHGPSPTHGGSYGGVHAGTHGSQHGGQQGGPPTSPPPQFTPQMQQSGISVFAVDPGAIRGCLYRFTYVWLNNRSKFWFYPVFVGRNSVAGWRWRNFRWVYFGIDLNEINNFECF